MGPPTSLKARLEALERATGICKCDEPVIVEVSYRTGKRRGPPVDTRKKLCPVKGHGRRDPLVYEIIKYSEPGDPIVLNSGDEAAEAVVLVTAEPVALPALPPAQVGQPQVEPERTPAPAAAAFPELPIPSWGTSQEPTPSALQSCCCGTPTCPARFALVCVTCGQSQGAHRPSSDVLLLGGGRIEGCTFTPPQAAEVQCLGRRRTQSPEPFGPGVTRATGAQQEQDQ